MYIFGMPRVGVLYMVTSMCVAKCRNAQYTTLHLAVQIDLIVQSG
jgi:hypothetical protein